MPVELAVLCWRWNHDAHSLCEFSGVSLDTTNRGAQVVKSLPEHPLAMEVELPDTIQLVES
jgi:hypothetical protein